MKSNAVKIFEAVFTSNTLLTLQGRANTVEAVWGFTSKQPPCHLGKRVSSMSSA